MTTILAADAYLTFIAVIQLLMSDTHLLLLPALVFAIVVPKNALKWLIKFKQAMTHAVQFLQKVQYFRTLVYICLGKAIPFNSITQSKGTLTEAAWQSIVKISLILITFSPQYAVLIIL